MQLTRPADFMLEMSQKDRDELVAVLGECDRFFEICAPCSDDEVDDFQWATDAFVALSLFAKELKGK